MTDVVDIEDLKDFLRAGVPDLYHEFVSNGDQLSIEITEDRPLYTREEMVSMIKDTLEIEEILDSWGDA